MDGIGGVPSRDSAVRAGGDAIGGAMLTVPNRKPESCKTRVTPPSACPVKLGIRNACGNAASVVKRLIFGAAMPLAFGAGLCPSTWSGGGPRISIRATEPTSNPRRRILICAARGLSPSTLGISTRCGPRLSATRICQPRRTRVPGAGSCERILPSGIEAL